MPNPCTAKDELYKELQKCTYFNERSAATIPVNKKNKKKQRLQRGVGRAPCIANCIIIWQGQLVIDTFCS
ncbi:hypothetical protein ACSBR1_035922 [Camellia fascicularis]